jgi:hypothetical protein
MLEHRALVAAVAAASALAFAGCSDDDEPVGPTYNPTPATQFTGVFAGGADGGQMSVTIMSTSLAAARPGAVGRLAPPRLVAPGLVAPGPADSHSVSTSVQALATLSPTGGGVANLTGTYDTAADTLNLSGSGYSMRGVRTGSTGSSELLGSVIGPNGTAGMRCGEGSTGIKTYCATYSSNSTALTGRFNFYISGTEITGVAVAAGANAGAWIGGTATGTGATRSITFTGFFQGPNEFSGTGVLAVATGDVAGLWTLYDDLGNPIDSGSWSGVECLQGTAGPN